MISGNAKLEVLLVAERVKSGLANARVEWEEFGSTTFVCFWPVEKWLPCQSLKCGSDDTALAYQCRQK